jgi:hypothetical protein
MLSAAIGAAGEGPRVQVTQVTPGGAVLPLAGAEVLLETWGHPGAGPDAERVLLKSQVAVTDPGGSVTFLPPVGAPGGGAGETPGANPDHEHVPSVIFHGLSYHGTPLGAEGEQEIRVYEPTPERGDLAMSQEVELRIEDKLIFVDLTVALMANGRRTIDLRDTPLRVPLWVPAVLGQPVDPGLIPEGAERNMRLGLEPGRGRLLVEGGGVAYRGSVVPGQLQRLSIRYGIPIEAERLALGVDPSVDLESLVVSAVWSNLIAPILVADRSFLTVEQPNREHVVRAVRFDPPPKRGEPVVLHLDRLPRPGVLERWVAYGGLAVAGLGLVFCIAWRLFRSTLR